MVTSENFMCCAYSIEEGQYQRVLFCCFRLGVLIRREVLIIFFIISLLLPCLVVNSCVLSVPPIKDQSVPHKKGYVHMENIFLSPLRELSSFYQTGNAMLHRNQASACCACSDCFAVDIFEIMQRRICAVW